MTCEHASPRIPKELGDLGLPAAVLASHRAFDVGALGIAEVLARALHAPLHVGEWSRLVADLNRSAVHAGVIARRVDGRRVPGNALSSPQRTERLHRYWLPYRDAVAGDVHAASKRGPVLHLSVHSFVEELHGVHRGNDIGLLHDPHRPHEVGFCEALKALLVNAGLVTRRNFPYFGNTDGFTSHLRGQLPATRYLGIELECNQRLARTRAGQRRLAVALVAALRAMLA